MRDAKASGAAMAAVPEKIRPHALVEEMENSFLDYSMSVIVHRALPDVRDGLKPVHRRILYAMAGLGLGPRQGYKKSATVVGEVLGKYHPHGDSAVYDAMVRLAQDFSMAHPLVDGQGNFGSIDGDSAAAYRYTEARLSEIAALLLEDIDQDTVDFRDNYDGRHKEPEVLPARLPNLLVNGSEGIAVGMATKVPPHNLREIGAAIALLCDRPDVEDDDLLRLIKGPDFPTGGILVHTPGIAQFKRTGKGLMTLRARAHVERGRGGKVSLVFTEIPYGVVKAKILETIAELVRDSRVERKAEGSGKRTKKRKNVVRDYWADWIAELRDESDREGMRIVVELKRDVDPAKVLDRLYAKTTLQVSYGARLLALVEGVPRVLPLRRALEIFVAHRLEIIVRRARFNLDKAIARAHVLEGLLIAIDNIDRVVKIIRESLKRETASTKLQKEFRLSQVQAEAILNLRLAQLTALDVSELKGELLEKRKLIKELEALLKDPAAQRAVVKRETEELVDRFGRPRRTQIVKADEAKTLMQRAAEEYMSVHVSSAGYLRAVPEGERARFRHREGEVGLAQLLVQAGERAVLFTDGGFAYSLQPEEVPAGSGVHVSRVVRGAGRGERILWAATPAEVTRELSVLFVSEQGYVKRTWISEYKAPRAGGLAAVSVAEGDRLVRILPVTDDQEVILSTAQGKAIRFQVSDVPVQGRVARGVIGIKLANGDRVVSAGAAADHVLVLTEQGVGKRVPTASFPLQKRAGQGVVLHKTTPRSGLVVCGMPIVAGQRVALVGEEASLQLGSDAFPEAERHIVGERVVETVADAVRFVLPVIGRTGGRPAGTTQGAE